MFGALFLMLNFTGGGESGSEQYDSFNGNSIGNYGSTKVSTGSGGSGGGGMMKKHYGATAGYAHMSQGSGSFTKFGSHGTPGWGHGRGGNGFSAACAPDC
eukprot:JP448622.1.p1 GENE.JP448622.1~~JP448622.1.p1  ORF type:complete len:100 (+),score=16.41 JP448622.1:29-328(+)